MKHVRKVVTLTTAVSMLTVNTLSTTVYADSTAEGGEITQNNTPISENTNTTSYSNITLPPSTTEPVITSGTTTPEAPPSDTVYLSPDTLPEDTTAAAPVPIPTPAPQKLPTYNVTNYSADEVASDTSDVGANDAKNEPITGDGFKYYIDKQELTISKTSGLKNWKYWLENESDSSDLIFSTLIINELDINDEESEESFPDLSSYDSLKEVRIANNSTTTLPDNFFDNCASIETIDLSGCTELTTIGASAFSGCKNLNNITLPANINYIKDFAFSNTENLKSIQDIHIAEINEEELRKQGKTDEEIAKLKIDKLKTAIIELDAFDYSENNKGNFPLPNKIPDGKFEALRDANGNITNPGPAFGDEGIYTIPESIIYIGDNAFSGNSNLKAIKFPENNNIQEIGKSTFKDCSGLAEALILSNCTNLKIIGNNAFNNCTGLTDVQLPASIQTIEHDAFYGCNGLKSLNFAGNTTLTTIGTAAFNNCQSLCEITLPENFQYIRADAFTGTGLESLEQINIDVKGSINRKILEEKGLDTDIIKKLQENGIFTLNGPKLKDELAKKEYGLKEDQITALCNEIERARTEKFSTLIIELDAFNYKDDNSDNFPLPNKIPDGYFEMKKDITGTPIQPDHSIDDEEGVYTIPKSIIYIGENAFTGNTDLTKIVIPEGSQLSVINNGIFKDCTNLTSIEISVSSTFEIKKGAFIGTGLTDLTLSMYDKESKSYKTIDLESSGGKVPDEIIIEMDSFANSMKNAPKPNKIPNDYFKEKDFTENSGCYEIPADIIYIGDNAFSGNSSLKKIVLPDSILDLGTKIFSDCKNLEEVVFSNCTKLPTIGTSTFSGCDKLTTIDLSTCTSLKTIEASSFSECKKVTDIKLPSSIRYIKDSAFKGTSLNAFTLYDENGRKIDTLPDDLIIEWDAFDYEEHPGAFPEPNKIPDGKFALTKDEDGKDFIPDLPFTTIPDSIIYIGDNAFVGNTNLKEIVFSSDLKEIGTNAFSGCSDLKQVIFEGIDPPDFGNSPFGSSENNKNLKILVPYDSWDEENHGPDSKYAELLGGFNFWYIPKTTLEVTNWEGQQATLFAHVHWHKGKPSYEYQWEMYNEKTGQWDKVGEASKSSTYLFASVTDNDYGRYRCRVTAVMEDKTREELLSSEITLDKKSIGGNNNGDNTGSGNGNNNGDNIGDGNGTGNNGGNTGDGNGDGNNGGNNNGSDNGWNNRPNRPNRPSDGGDGSGGSSSGNGGSGSSSPGTDGSGNSAPGDGGSGSSSSGDGNSEGASQGGPGNGGSGDSSQNNNPGGTSNGNDNSGNPSWNNGGNDNDSHDGQTTDGGSSRENVGSAKDGLNDPSQDSNGSSLDGSQLTANTDTETKGVTAVVKQRLNVLLFGMIAFLCMGRIIIGIITRKREDDE